MRREGKTTRANLEGRFDAGEDVVDYFDLEKATHPNREGRGGRRQCGRAEWDHRGVGASAGQGWRSTDRRSSRHGCRTDSSQRALSASSATPRSGRCPDDCSEWLTGGALMMTVASMGVESAGVAAGGADAGAVLIRSVAIIGKGALGLMYADAIVRALGPDAVRFVMDDGHFIGATSTDVVHVNGEERCVCQHTRLRRPAGRPRDRRGEVRRARRGA